MATMATGESDAGMGSAASWNASWRADVSRQLEVSGQAHQQSALILERLSNRLDEHDRRIGALEAQPAGIRNNLTSYGGCLSQVAFAVLSAIGTLSGLIGIGLSITALILTHH